MTWPGEADRKNPDSKKALDEWYKEIKVRQGLSFEEFDLLWEAVLDRVEEIDKASKADRTNRGSHRDQALISMGSKAVETHFVIWQADGRSKFHHIRAYYNPGDFHKPLNRRVVTIKVEVYWSDNDEFNQSRYDRLTKEPDKILIVNHQFYALGPGDRGGFGGRLIKFQRIKGWNTGPSYPDGPEPILGEVETTNDLWYSGVIPPAWRDRLPDNAIFVPYEDGSTFDGPTVMY